MHNLQFHVCEQYRADMGECLPQGAHLAPMDALGDACEEMLALEAGGAVEGGEPAAGALVDAMAHAAHAAAPQPHGQQPQAFEQMPKKNKTHRTATHAWLATRPAPRVLSMGIALPPMLAHMSEKLKHAGDVYDTREAAKATRAGPGAAFATQGEWLALVAASGKLEEQAMRSIQTCHVYANATGFFLGSPSASS